MLRTNQPTFQLQASQPPRPIEICPPEFRPSTTSDNAVDAAVTPGILCSKCQSIRSWLVASSAQLDQKSNKIIRYTYHHFPTAREIEESCKNGCHLCTLMWDAIVWDLNNPRVIGAGWHFWYPTASDFAKARSAKDIAVTYMQSYPRKGKLRILGENIGVNLDLLWLGKRP